MFTGLIEEIGSVRHVVSGAEWGSIAIGCRNVLSGTKIGDSIAVNGICLTVTQLLDGKFSADVMHETLNRSALAQLGHGSHVNLERAMAADGRFGGHIVAGHADGIGTVLGTKRDDTAVWYTIEAEPAVLRYIVEKGSVTVDGISLTVASVSEKQFSISAIPHTVEQTVLKEKKAGDSVNLETDIIGKYVEKLMRPAVPDAQKSRITKEFLSRYGF